MFTSMFVVFLIGTPFISFFSTKQILDPIREDGPSDHIIKKVDTPTMGGALILTGLFSGTLLWGDLFNPYVWFLIFIVASFGLLGAYDDYKKIKFNKNTTIKPQTQNLNRSGLNFSKILERKKRQVLVNSPIISNG